MLTGRKYTSTPRAAGVAPGSIQNLTIYRERNFRTGTDQLKVSYDQGGVEKHTDMNGLAAEWMRVKCAAQVEKVRVEVEASTSTSSSDGGCAPGVWKDGVPCIAVSGRLQPGEVVIDESQIPVTASPEERLRMMREQYATKVGAAR